MTMLLMISHSIVRLIPNLTAQESELVSRKTISVTGGGM